LLLLFIVFDQKGWFSAGRHEARALIGGDGIRPLAIWKTQLAAPVMELSALIAMEAEARH